ncbi:hypothetical protein [Micromonospora sp. CPCC 206061]
MAAELVVSSMVLGFRTDVMLLAIILLTPLGKLSDSGPALVERRLTAR